MLFRFGDVPDVGISFFSLVGHSAYREADF